MTPEGNTDIFPIDTGVLQGDPFAPFLFVKCLLTMHFVVPVVHQLHWLWRKRGSRRIPEEVLAELANADNIVLIENTIKKAEDLRRKCSTIHWSLSEYSKTKDHDAYCNFRKQCTCSRWLRDWEGWRLPVYRRVHGNALSKVRQEYLRHWPSQCFCMAVTHEHWRKPSPRTLMGQTLKC